MLWIPEVYAEIQYEGETREEFLARSEAIRAHNERLDREYRYARAPAKALWPWCRKNAPWLLPEEEQ